MPLQARLESRPPTPLPSFRTVILDCDSTLSAIEGVDELANAHRDEITALTERAMRGEVPLESIYGARLDLIRPSRAAVHSLAEAYITAAIPDARETIERLQAGGVAVHILSGGFRQAIEPFAAWLGLPRDAVHAVDLWFDDDGQYAGFDERSPLTRSGGKRTILEAWRPPLQRPILLVGDGITDLEARPAVDRFVAFAGIVERPEVTAQADMVIRTPTLRPLLDLLLPHAAPNAAS